MTDWTQIQKLEKLAPFDAGISVVSRLIPRGAGTGAAIGFSDIAPGAMEVEVSDPELFILLEGQLDIVAGDRRETVVAHEAIWLPAGETVRIESEAGCRLIYAIIEGGA